MGQNVHVKTYVPETFKYWASVQGGQSYLFSLSDNPSSDTAKIKTPYGVDVLLHWPASHSIFSYWVG